MRAGIEGGPRGNRGIATRAAGISQGGMSRGGELSSRIAPRASARIETVTIGRSKPSVSPDVLGRPVTRGEIQGLSRARAENGRLVPAERSRAARLAEYSPSRRERAEFVGGRATPRRTYAKNQHISEQVINLSSVDKSRIISRQKRSGPDLSPRAITQRVDFQYLLRNSQFVRMPHVETQASLSSHTNTSPDRGRVGRRRYSHFARHQHIESRLAQRNLQKESGKRTLSQLSPDTQHFLTTLNRGGSEAEHRNVWHPTTASRRSREFHRRRRYQKQHTSGHDASRTMHRYGVVNPQPNHTDEQNNGFRVSVRGRGNERRWVGTVGNRNSRSDWFSRTRRHGQASREERMRSATTALSEAGKRTPNVYRKAGEQANKQLKQRKDSFRMSLENYRELQKKAREANLQTLKKAYIERKTQSSKDTRAIARARQQLAVIINQQGLGRAGAIEPTRSYIRVQPQVQTREGMARGRVQVPETNPQQRVDQRQPVTMPLGVPNNLEQPIGADRRVSTISETPVRFSHNSTGSSPARYETQSTRTLNREEEKQLNDTRQQLAVVQNELSLSDQRIIGQLSYTAKPEQETFTLSTTAVISPITKEKTTEPQQMSETELEELVRSMPKATIQETVQLLQEKSNKSALRLFLLVIFVRTQMKLQSKAQTNEYQLLQKKESSKTEAKAENMQNTQAQAVIPTAEEGYAFATLGSVQKEDQINKKLYFIRDTEADNNTKKEVFEVTNRQLDNAEDEEEISMVKIADEAVPALQKVEQKSALVRKLKEFISSKYELGTKQDGRLPYINAALKAIKNVTKRTYRAVTVKLNQIFNENPAVKIGERGANVTKKDVLKVDPKIKVFNQLA